ncbi:replication initiator [Herbidospora daliensis]|uniref:replication initiator n=1 Tax=Herbidospora daliensis TaxID=295585 RepID=UPI000AA14091|nr:replication initiator [Herbidospora daliensis]
MPPTTRNAHAIDGMISRLNAPDYDRWAVQIRRAGGCAQPIHLRGRAEYRDRQTGALLHRYTTRTEPDGVLRLPCKTRRASRCPACAETYRADTYHLIRAGLIGGKGVPASVASHPCLFVTLTAPSFGPVHTHREHHGKTHPCHARRAAPTCGHGRVLSCKARHRIDEPVLGEPLCPGCYDHAGSVLFNALAPLLWKRFTDALRRHLAKSGGLTLKEMRDHLAVSFAKVAEYQRRGVVHLHAVIRLDGPDGPNSRPPTWATCDLLAAAVTHSARVVRTDVPALDDEPARVLRWGAQLDIRPITLSGDLTESAVAAYIAKYATKAAECVGTLDRPIRLTDDLAALPVRDHARRLIAECFRLNDHEATADLRLAHWAHMLGFRGHFSTRSRHYSVGIGDIRADRTAHARLPLLDDDPEIVATWEYVGRGLNLGDQAIAAAITGGAI